MALPAPHIVNLFADPKERKTLDYPYVHSSVATHVFDVLAACKGSVAKVLLIPLGAALAFVPAAESP